MDLHQVIFYSEGKIGLIVLPEMHSRALLKILYVLCSTTVHCYKEKYWDRNIVPRRQHFDRKKRFASCYKYNFFRSVKVCSLSGWLGGGGVEWGGGVVAGS